jgi:hypothetical protein
MRLKEASMVRRIACAVVVCSLLMLWPSTAAAEEDEGRLMVMLEEYSVLPDKGAEYETLIKEMVAVFEAHGFPHRLDSYKMDDLRYLAIWWFEGTAGIDRMHGEWAKLTGEWGEEKAADWTGKLFETVTHWKSSIWMPRSDLSYFPENQTDEYRYVVWGLLPIKAGHQHEVEALFKRYVKVFAEHEVPHAWSAASGFIGVEYPTLGFVEWAASPGSYWIRHDENMANEELSKKTNALWEEMLPHIRGFEWAAGWYLNDLSYRPEKKEEAGQN